MDAMTEDGKRVLVVDDSISIRRMVSYMLTNAGYKVEQVGDGEQAVVRLLSNHIDLVLLDINMPVMDGFETLRRLREDQSLAATKVVVMTTEEGEDDRKRAGEMGVLDYLVKPFQPTELINTVRRYLGDVK